MVPNKNFLLPGQIVARRIKEARKRRGWTQQQLADRLGVQRPTITKIEQGGDRAKNFSVFDLLAFASALGVAPVHLLVPLEDEAEVRIADNRDPLPAPIARQWIRGFHLLDDSDFQAWFDQLPRSEVFAMLKAGFAAQGRVFNEDEWIDIYDKSKTFEEQKEKR
jgi:transcriptional regulator with XRE-family HTH domain